MADLKSINGLASANIKSINGLAIASVKSFNGLNIISGFDIGNASYDNKSFSISEDNGLQDLFFNNDGTKMFIVGDSSDKIYQYSLSTAWDVSTASYEYFNTSVSSQGGEPTGLFFNNDGTKMYVGNGSAVYQYSLSSWDLTTCGYANKSFSVYNQSRYVYGLFFKSDGTKMYCVSAYNNKVYQYSLSTAWDVSTASYDSKYFSVSSQDSNSNGLSFKSDGTKMFVVGTTNDKVYQYSLSTAWDVSTASYDSKYFSVSSQDGVPAGLFLKSDLTKMYISGNSSDKIYQYSLS